jgi:hypothetical protein
MPRAGLFAALTAAVTSASLLAACGNTGGGLTTGSVFGSATALPADAPQGISNQDPMARPVQVAWTSARAKRCGFYFDPAKLRSSYLAYEAKQGAAGEQLARIEKTYDSTYKTVGDKIANDPDYCTDRKGAEIKADLQRHLAGDFTPNLPKPKPVTGLFDWVSSTPSDEPFDQKKFWEKQDRDRKR